MPETSIVEVTTYWLSKRNAPGGDLQLVDVYGTLDEARQNVPEPWRSDERAVCGSKHLFEYEPYRMYVIDDRCIVCPEFKLQPAPVTLDRQQWHVGGYSNYGDKGDPCDTCDECVECVS
jgi:hypothetical protein